MYRQDVSQALVSKVTDGILEELTALAVNRPLDGCYPILYTDAMIVKVRNGTVDNRPAYRWSGRGPP